MSHKSAIVIMPPEASCWEAIQYFRKMHHHVYEKWPPHATISYPCVAPTELPRLEALLKATLTMEPFELSFDTLHVLRQGKAGTLVLTTQIESKACTALANTIYDVLEENFDLPCPKRKFTLHLSLAKFGDWKCAQRLATHWEDYFSNQVAIKFQCDRVVLLEHKADSKSMSMFAEVPFESVTPKTRSLPLTYTVTMEPQYKHSVEQAMKTRKLRQTVPLATYQWDESRNTWLQCSNNSTPTPAQASDNKSTIRMMTYNVLMDAYEKDKIFSEVRWQRMLTYLCALDLDVIALQEVTPAFLDALFDGKNAWVRKYKLSDCTGVSVQPYGQLLLVKRECNVVYKEYRLSNQKTILCAEVATQEGETWHIATMHLTSSHSFDNLKDAMVVREKQMAVVYSVLLAQARGDTDVKAVDGDSAPELVLTKLMEFAESGKQRTYFCIMGDFNFGDNTDGEERVIRPPFVDVWPLLQENETGFTFEPSMNKLAKLNSKQQQDLRLDRILFYNGVSSESVPTVRVPQRIALAGVEPFEHKNNDLWLSDHFGVLCEFGIRTAQSIHEEAKESMKIMQAHEMEDQKRLEDSLLRLPQLTSVLMQQHGLERDGKMREGLRLATMQLIKDEIVRIFTASEKFFVSVVGSAFVDLDDVASDVDVLVAGKTTSSKFFKELKKGFASSAVGRLVRVVSPEEAIVPIAVMEFPVRLPHITTPFTVQVDMQYACVPAVATINTKHLNAANVLKQGLAKAREGGQSQRALTGLQDGLELSQLIATVPTFAVAFSVVKRWAKANGIYGNRFGFLGGFGWMLMLLKCAQVCAPATKQVHTFVSAFFNLYANWDFSERAVEVRLSDGQMARAANVVRTSKEMLMVTALSPPHHNIARNITRGCLLTMQVAFAAATLIENYNDLFTPQSVFAGLESKQASSSKSMGTQFPMFLRVNVAAPSLVQYESWVGFVESRLVRLLQSAENVAVGSNQNDFFHVRIWPEAFAPMNEQEYRRVYYIGVGSPPKPFMAAVSVKSGGNKTRAKFQAVMQESIDDFLFDTAKWTGKTNDMSVTVECLVRSDVPPIEEMRLAVDIERQHALDREHNDGLFDQKMPSTIVPSTKNAKNASFISSEEVFNRLRWDPVYERALGQFTICYEDRFEGMQEAPFSTFANGRDTTSESFIPWHRVWFFKRQGEVVWDRKAKIDRIFGTTMQPNPEQVVEAKSAPKKRGKSKTPPRNRSRTPPNKRK